MNSTITPEMVRERLEAAFHILDIPTEVERLTGIRLHLISRTGKQYGGACPFPDCLVDTDGFSVWPVLTPRGKHYYCRGCRRSGDIIGLLQDIKGLGFSDACKELGIPNPYLDDSNKTYSGPQIKRHAPKAEQWQLDELAYLNAIYERSKLALQRDRARSYLAERDIPFDLAVEQGIGYIPALSEVKHITPEIERFQRWCDRIIFPIFTPKGELGYCGRSLFLWESGIDEDEHKRRIDNYNLQVKEQYGEKAHWHQMPRWKYTYQQGFFNWQAVKEFDTLVFVEGAFDALASMACGISNVLAIGTTGLDASLLPINISDAIMGLDIDGPGCKAAKQLATSLRRKGIDVSVCTPAESKDWSAAYRVYGEQGLVPLKDMTNLCYDCLDQRKDTPAFYEIDDIMYCKVHYVEHKVNTIC